MAFVASFFVERKSLESVELTSDDEEPQPNSDTGTEIQNHHFNNEIDNTVDVPAAENITATEIQNEEDITAINKSSQPQPSQAKKAKTIKRGKIQPPQTASAVLMSKLLEAQNKSPQHDELDRFFLHISDTVKKFSPYLQAIAKNKIFSLVSEMELQQLAPPNFATATPQYAYASSPASTSSSVQASATPMPPSPELWNTNEWNNSNQA